jgi:GTP-binding protein
MKKKLVFTQARFVASAYSQDSFPKLITASGRLIPEIAIVGRSNVGKSSLINHLLKRKLAKTSSIPGKTQSINFFCVDEQVALIDLPGYGYAKAPKQVKKQWSEIIDQYLQNRSTLQLILFLLDSRRQPAEEDLAFIQWASFHQKPLLIVFTKTDKINEIEKKQNTLVTMNSLKKFQTSGPLYFLHYSIKDSSARMELIDKINCYLKSLQSQKQWPCGDQHGSS